MARTEKLLDAREAARKLNVDPQTIRRYWREGLLPYVEVPKGLNSRVRKVPVSAIKM